MRAAVRSCSGEQSSIRIKEVAQPVAGDGQVLVRVMAVGVNPADWQVAAGWMDGARSSQGPVIVGHEFSGIVEHVGPGCSDVSEGDAVIGRTDSEVAGALAEYVAVDESTLVGKPARLDHIEASSIAMTGVTAWQALVEAAGLGKRQKVLVHAGAGGVGATAIQLARHLGAYVSSTCSDRNLYYVLDLGAHRSIDYSRGRFEEIASERDVVLDSIGGRVTLRSIQATREGGTVVSIADQWTHPEYVPTGLDAMAQAWLRWRCQRLARRRGVRWLCLRTRTDARALRAVADLYESGVLRPQVSRIFEFEEAGDAIAMSRGLRVRGKLVVAVDRKVGRDASPSEGVLWDSQASYRSVSSKREQDEDGALRPNGDEEATWSDRPAR